MVASQAVASQSTPAKKTAKAKPAKSTGAKKPAASTSTHPSSIDMIVEAIKTLKGRGGSSLQAIKKFIVDTHQVDMVKYAPFIRRALKHGVETGTLTHTKGSGASGSFKLAEKKTSAGAVEKKPKSAAKKTTAKKATKAKAEATSGTAAEKKLKKKATAKPKTKTMKAKAPAKPRSTGKKNAPKAKAQ